MKPYLAILAARFRVLWQYRAAALAGLMTQIFFGLVIIAGLTAFYQSANSPALLPLSLAQTVTYVWLGQAMLTVLPWRMDPDVKAAVTSGGLAYELLRPLHLCSLWFARALALRAAPLVLRAAPLLVIATLFLNLQAPPSILSAFLWAAGLVGAIALGAALTLLMSISLLWTLSGEGAQFIMPAMANLFSGLLIPLPLFPDWAQTIIGVLPFRGLMDTPNRLWLGDLNGLNAFDALLHQWLWIAGLLLLAEGLLRIGLRRVVIQGG